VRAGKGTSTRTKRSPVAVHLRAASWRARADVFPGTKVDLIVHDAIEGADLYGGVIEIDPGTRAPLHWHRRGELQFVLSGRGFLLRPNGRETAVSARSAVFSPRGRAGAHGFRAVGKAPLTILFLYGSPGGKRPWITVVKD